MTLIRREWPEFDVLRCASVKAMRMPIVQGPCYRKHAPIQRGGCLGA